MKNSLKLSFLFVILSFFIHLYLAHQHYDLKYGFESTKSLCNINDTFNCEAVALSSYSYFLNIPIAVWGSVFHFIYFIILAMLTLTHGAIFQKMNFLFALISILATLTMGSLSILMLSTYCLFCIILYILSVFNFISVLKTQNFSKKFHKSDLKNKWTWGSGLAIFFLSFLIHDMSLKSYAGQNTHFITESIQEWESSPSYQFEKPLFSMGLPDAPIKITEFADFQCIHCKNAASKLHAFSLSNKDIYFEFYAYPLDGRCNPGVPPRDGRSCLMARAVYCSEKEHMGSKAHDWIFNRFGSQDSTNFETLKSDLKLSAEFLECLESSNSMSEIERQALIGQKAKIEGTPTVFVNGKRLPAGHYIPVLESLYKKLKANQSK